LDCKTAWKNVCWIVEEIPPIVVFHQKIAQKVVSEMPPAMTVQKLNTAHDHDRQPPLFLENFRSVLTLGIASSWLETTQIEPQIFV
jgi:hypothetical protein